MKKIEIISLFARNFLSLGNIRLNIEPGLFLIEGRNEDLGWSNGAGKSSFAVEILAYALFGETVKATTDVWHWASGKDDIPRVAVKFKIENNVFAIRRSASWLSFAHIKGGVEQFTLTGRTRAATQACINQELGMDWKTFCASFLFGQSSVFKFSQMANKQRKQIIETAVGVEVYRKAAKSVDEEIKENANTCFFNSEKITRKNVDITNLDQVILKQRNLLQARSARLLQLKEDRAAFMVKKTNLPAQDMAGSEDIKVWVKEHEEAVTLAYRATRDLMQREAIRRSKIKNLQNAEVDCPTCGKPLDDVSMDDIAAQIQVQESKCALLQKRIVKAKAYEEKMRRLAKRYTDALALEQDRMAEEQRLDSEIRFIDKAIVELSTADQYFDLKESENRRFLIKKEMAELVAVDEEIRNHQKHLLYLQQIMGDKGVATAVVEHAVPVLNDKAGEVSDALGLADRPVFSATREGKKNTINEVTLSIEKDGELRPYENASGGEGVNADLAVGIAIQALIARESELNLVVFDEVLDKLDRPGAEAVIGYLRNLAKHKTVWLITHADWVRGAAHWDGVYTLIKKNGVSSLGEE